MIGYYTNYLNINVKCDTFLNIYVIYNIVCQNDRSKYNIVIIVLFKINVDNVLGLILNNGKVYHLMYPN